MADVSWLQMPSCRPFPTPHGAEAAEAEVQHPVGPRKLFLRRAVALPVLHRGEVCPCGIGLSYAAFSRTVGHGDGWGVHRTGHNWPKSEVYMLFFEGGKTVQGLRIKSTAALIRAGIGE